MSSVVILGWVASIFSIVGFLPQLIKIIKTKSTEDLSWGLFLSLMISYAVWAIYGVTIDSIPLIFVNSTTFSFSVVILIYKIKFG